MRRTFLLALFVASAAHAWPVDVYVDVKPSEEKFQKLAALDWTEVETPAVADVEALPSGEALVTGKKSGETLVLLYAEGKMGVWKVRVGASPKENAELLSKARTACPDLKTDGGELTVTVKSEPCRAALKALFQTDAYNARQLDITFDLPILQSQLKELQAAIDAAVGKGKAEATYSGAGLILKGDVTEAQHKKILWAVFKTAVGRVALEDRLNLTDKKPAAQDDEQ